MFGSTCRDMGTIFRTMTAPSGQQGQRVLVQRLACQRGFVLENTIISCALGSNIDSIQFMTMRGPATKGQFWQHNLIIRTLSQG